MSNSFDVSISISKDLICGVLCSACEGGSGYWAKELKHKAPSNPNMIPEDFREFTGWAYANCWGDGKAVLTDHYENDGKKLILDEASIKRGVELCAKYMPRTMSAILTEEFDAHHGDVFLQCCLFPEYVEKHHDVVYG